MAGYLASDALRCVTGTELVIDGGMNAGGVPQKGYVYYSMTPADDEAGPGK